MSTARFNLNFLIQALHHLTQNIILSTQITNQIHQDYCHRYCIGFTIGSKDFSSELVQDKSVSSAAPESNPTFQNCNKPTSSHTKQWAGSTIWGKIRSKSISPFFATSCRAVAIIGSDEKTFSHQRLSPFSFPLPDLINPCLSVVVLVVIVVIVVVALTFLLSTAQSNKHVSFKVWIPALDGNITKSNEGE